ncbi:Acyl-CoA hydrolase [Pseudomonas syringae pv. actinidiae]|uniref:Acyl-CoA hydrolase n=3 Tax=Pseudomonas syringae group TaxID=136849 RepID=A0AAN4TIN0_PSESF|nr:Acyl-CoA hydrolase [Pseudomonas syringae pv. actinidiae]
MRRVDHAHHVRGIRIGIPVRVQLLRQLAISLLDLLRRGIASNTQQLVMRGRSLHCTCCPWPTAIFDTAISAKKPIAPVQMPRNKNQPTRKCPNPEDPGIS